eukprot:1138194-Pelagomonas_calceolata.AAC.1
MEGRNKVQAVSSFLMRALSVKRCPLQAQLGRKIQQHIITCCSAFVYSLNRVSSASTIPQALRSSSMKSSIMMEVENKYSLMGLEDWEAQL